MKNKIKLWIKAKLGITVLELEVGSLHNEVKNLTEKNERLEKFCLSISEDNKLIIHHIKMINKDFFVAADINVRNDHSSVVVVMKNFKGQPEVLKTYSFNEKTVEEIHRFLEGFGKDRVVVDQPRHFRGPKFRY